MIVLLAETTVDPLAGGIVGGGLFGMLLAWLLYKGLPDQKAQIKELLEAAAAERHQNYLDREAERKQWEAERQQHLAEREIDRQEREKDREARHHVANVFNQSVLEMTKDFVNTMNSSQVRHSAEAQKDRDAFMTRNLRIEEAIRTQTKELKEAITGTCQYPENKG